MRGMHTMVSSFNIIIIIIIIVIIVIVFFCLT